MDGIDLDPNVLIQVQSNQIAQQSIRISQLEAAVQQLAMEKEQLQAQIPNEEKEDASAADGG